MTKKFSKSMLCGGFTGTYVWFAEPEYLANTVDNWQYTVSNGQAELTGYVTKPTGAVTIPSTLGGYPVTSIGNDAFRACKDITSVTIGNGVTEIGNKAFIVVRGLKAYGLAAV